MDSGFRRNDVGGGWFGTTTFAASFRIRPFAISSNVTPAKAGVRCGVAANCTAGADGNVGAMDSGFRRNDVGGFV